MSKKVLVLIMDILLTVILLSVCILEVFNDLDQWIYVVLAVVLVAALAAETIAGIKFLGMDGVVVPLDNDTKEDTIVNKAEEEPVEKKEE